MIIIIITIIIIIIIIDNDGCQFLNEDAAEGSPGGGKRCWRENGKEGEMTKQTARRRQPDRLQQTVR